MLKRLLQAILIKLPFTPPPQVLAAQLRRPSGIIAKKVGLRMNDANAALYGLMLDTMPVAAGDRLLEIGFGNGNYFEKVLAKAENVSAAGIDFSEEMVAEATANCAAYLAAGKLTLQHGSSDKLSFPDSFFNTVYCANVVYFWEQPEQHLREIHRVLKPGGRFITAIRSKESMQALPVVPYGFKLYNSAEWSTVLTQNGFKVEAVHEKEEPPVELGNDTFVMQSVCISAQKP